MSERVIITGVGTVNPVGIGWKNFWNGCLAGHSVVKKIPDIWKHYARFNSEIWSPLGKIDYNDFFISKRELRCNDPVSILAICATIDALRYADIDLIELNDKNRTIKLDKINRKKIGVFIGTGSGGISTAFRSNSHQLLANTKDKIKKLDNANGKTFKSVLNNMIHPKKYNFFTASMFMPNTIASKIGVKLSINGPTRSFCSACASSTVAIGNAYRAIKDREIDIAIVGGSEYFNDHYGTCFRAFDIIKAIADSVETICPFDVKRKGFLFTEGGAGILILENLKHAEKRNVSGIAEIVGYSENSDSYSMMAPEPGGKQIASVLDSVCEQSKLKTEDIDYINPNGTGTISNDSIEAKVIKKIFGAKPYINATKSITGHVMGASGAIETIVTALSIKNQTSHICKNLTNPIEDLNFIFKEGKLAINNAIKLSNGFGGHNCAVALKRIS